MKEIKLKLKALTPIHIGTGENYEPTNFVIDDGYLYEFDEFEFFNHLDNKQKKLFLSAVEKKSYESLFEIHRIIKNNKNIAKQCAFKKIQVSKSLENEYEKKVGRPVQFEGKQKNKKVFNKFQINKTLRFKNNSYQVYIPGSSIKGALLTAYGEFIYKTNRRLFNEMFNKCFPSQNGNVFKYLSVSDSKPLKTYSIIGYALNKERFEDDNQGPENIVEVIYSNEKQHSEFEVTLTFKSDMFCKKGKLNEIKKACNEHYLPIFKNMIDGVTVFRNEEVDDFTNEYFSNSFYETYKRLELKENQFLIRVGKYSQARAVTIDGLREINVKLSGGGPKRKPNRWQTLDQETTSWLFGLSKNNNSLMPFGWLLCEIIEEREL